MKNHADSSHSYKAHFQNEVFLTKADIAERYRISESTVDSHCSRNPSALPPYIKLGTASNSLIRFPMSGVMEFERRKLSEAQQFGDGEASDNRDLDQLLQEL